MRKFLVVLDDSKECLNAMRFAAMRAEHTGGDVEILGVIQPEEFNHWIGVGSIMREEAKERIHAHYEVFAKWMRDKHDIDPRLVIREGKPVDKILERVEQSQEIGVVVLGAASGRRGPGPIISALLRQSGNLAVPMTIVPGEMSKDRLKSIT